MSPTPAALAELETTEDGCWRFRTPAYEATLDPRDGRLVGLSIADHPWLAQRDANALGIGLYDSDRPLTPCLVRRLTANTVRIWDTHFDLRWRFLPESIEMEFVMHRAAEPLLKLFFCESIWLSDAAEPPEGWWYEPIRLGSAPGDGPLMKVAPQSAVVLRGPGSTNLRVQGPSFEASGGLGGGSNPSDWPRCLRVPLTLGRVHQARMRITPPHERSRDRAEICAQGAALDHRFTRGQPLRFWTPLRLSPSSMPGPVRVSLSLEEPNTQKTIWQTSQDLDLALQTTHRLDWSVPWDRPGVYQGNFRVHREGLLLGERPFALTYDLDRWQPGLYRPGDFWSFWSGLLQEMRSLPLEPELSLDEAQSTDQRSVYRVEVTGFACRRIVGIYAEPGPPVATPRPTSQGLPTLIGESDPLKGPLRVDGPCLWLKPLLGKERSFQRGVSNRYASGLLYCILDWLRWLDFLRSRGQADWSRCAAVGEGSAGPVALAAAALDQRLRLLVLNGAPCNRWDWALRHTGGHGPMMSDRQPNQSPEQFIQEMAYFDPSHFAERVTIPVLGSWGMLDEAAPLAGQMSAWAHLSGPRTLELRPWHRGVSWSEPFRLQAQEALHRLYHRAAVG